MKWRFHFFPSHVLLKSIVLLIITFFTREGQIVGVFGRYNVNDTFLILKQMSHKIKISTEERFPRHNKDISHYLLSQHLSRGLKGN